jgi:hypothetical protein
MRPLCLRLACHLLLIGYTPEESARCPAFDVGAGLGAVTNAGSPCGRQAGRRSRLDLRLSTVQDPCRRSCRTRTAATRLPVRRQGNSDAPTVCICRKGGRRCREVSGGRQAELPPSSWGLQSHGYCSCRRWIGLRTMTSVRPPDRSSRRLEMPRGRLLTLGAGLIATCALLFTARNFTLSREGRVTDRYTRAVTQLGDEKLDVRISGIYALERIARDSETDHPTVMEVLTAFIREHSQEPYGHRQRPGSDNVVLPSGWLRRRLVWWAYRWLTPEGRDQKRTTRPDVEAAITVVGRRDSKRDIRRINLRGANFSSESARREPPQY